MVPRWLLRLFRRLFPVPRGRWRWYGHAGHLVVGQDCRFHLCTQVGPWLVSTVGEYFPDESVREILAKSKGIELEGKGDARRADFMDKHGWVEIGYARTYETMVFPAGEPCSSDECGCGMPTAADWGERDCQGYNDAGSATRGHYATCEKWASEPAEEVAHG